LADQNRLGVAGFSYGAVLTAYTITHTNRFHAASLNDASFDLWTFAAKYAANPEFRRFWDDTVGYSDPYEPSAAARMRAQSPLLSVTKATTPTLMEAGAESSGGMEQGVLALFQAFQRLDVPSSFIRYPRTGHGLHEPRLRLESARNNLNWFDRWMIGHAP
jgi:dipeptidyl aminopeptidase/acylaminoacyl peptidase